MAKSFKTTCPKCGGNNFYVTPYNQMGYCFSPECHYTERNGKSLSHQQRIRSDNVNEIRAFYTSAANYYHSSLTPEATAFLYNRGFNDTTIQSLKIGYCPPGKSPLYKSPIAKEAGLATMDNSAFLANRITFPYFKDISTVTDIRGRTIDPNEELKYKSPFGDVYFRGAIYPYNWHLRNEKRIVLTEGEIKADISYQEGIPTMALPGIGTWRKGLVQDDDQEFIIVFDNESKPHVQREVIAAIRKVYKELVRAKIAVLPLLGDMKAEIDTFIRKHGGALYRSILDNALDYNTWNSLQTF